MKVRLYLNSIPVTLLQHRNSAGRNQRPQFVIGIFLSWCLLLTGALQPVLVYAQATEEQPEEKPKKKEKVEEPPPKPVVTTPPGTSFIPAFSVSERYDSNVWFAPASLLPPGTQLKDFATTVQGSVKGLHKDKNVEASLTGGVDGNFYVNNPGLNYVSTRLDLFANLNGWAEHLVKRAQLRVYDYFRYTPQSPGFLTGGRAGTSDPFLQGIQSFRANTFSNTLNTDGQVPVFRDLALQAGYRFSIIRVGSPIQTTASGAVVFFDTIMHTWSAGPKLQISRTDSVALLYQQNLISQTQAQTEAAPTLNTNTQTVTAVYSRLTPNWQFFIGGGVTAVEPGDKAFPTGSITISNSPERSTTVQLTLSRQASPSFYINAGANISNLAQLQVTHRYTKLLTLRGSVNYGYNETVPTSLNTTFTNFSLQAGANYRLSRTMSVDVFYDHNDFATKSPGLTYTVLRDAVGVALTMEWK